MSDFEQKLKEVREILRELETGNLSLDESVKKFEKGIRLVKECYESLEEVKRKIMLLVEESEGVVIKKTFDAEDIDESE